MKILSSLSALAFFAAGVTGTPLALSAQDVGADTLIDAPTPAGVIIRTDLAYDTHLRQKLDLYTSVARRKEPSPIIVFVHGGGWLKGSKADGRRLAFRFVAQGYAVACIDYRLSSDAEFPAQLEDCKSAVRWLRGNASRLGLDGEHIGLIGISAGGHLAALVGAMNSTRLYESGGSLDQHSRVQGIVDFFGPIDLLQSYDGARKQGAPLAGEISQLVGGDPHLLPVPVTAANPTLFADVESPPFLIIHGDKDTVIPVEQSRLLYDTLVEKRIPAHLHIIHGAGHTGPAFVAPEINALVDQFFTQTLKRGQNPPQVEVKAYTESNAAP